MYNLRMAARRPSRKAAKARKRRRRSKGNKKYELICDYGADIPNIEHAYINVDANPNIGDSMNGDITIASLPDAEPGDDGDFSIAVLYANESKILYASALRLMSDCKPYLSHTQSMKTKYPSLANVLAAFNESEAKKASPQDDLKNDVCDLCSFVCFMLVC